MTRVRFGIIGAGGIANGFHLPDLRQIEQAELVAVADVDGERARATAERWGAKAHYSDPAQLLAREDVDACIVATWHPTHVPLAIEVLRAGKHLLVQKPLTTRIDQANAFVRAASRARSRGQKVQCLPFNWTPAYDLARRLIGDGTIGQVCQARRRVAHGGPGRQSWFYNPEIAERGAGMDMGVYAVSGLTGLVGPARRAFGLAKTLEKGVRIDDNVVILLELAGGGLGVTETSWTQRGTRDGTSIHGSEGTLHLEPGDAEIHVFLTRPAPGWFRPTVPAAPSAAPHRHFVDCILRDQTPKGTPEHARHAVEIMCAAYETEKTGKAVKLKTTF
ncbi:MAG: Gfo/Idh/MocA family oxidoreductase [Planctomycetes bacterium]|nr:Gfo/Idh/MocA family oxidoreductase [Planctomycetota bacterium]